MTVDKSGVSFPRLEYNSTLLYLFRSVFARLRGRGLVLRTLIQLFPGLNNVFLVHNDVKLWLDLRNNSDMGHFYMKGNHHEIALQFFLELIKDKDTVLYDIGCNLGYYPLLLIKEIKQIYAFEPNPILMKRLKQFVESNKLENVKLVAKGLSDENGELKFYYSISRHDMGSFIRPDSFTDEVVVETARLDNCMVAENMLPPTIVKIDTEGYEIKVLKGFSNIQKSMPVVFMEWNRYDDTPQAYDSLANVMGPNYTVYKICSDNTLMSTQSHSDKYISYVLAIPKNHDSIKKISAYIVA